MFLTGTVNDYGVCLFGFSRFLSSEGIAECKKACMKENPSTSECLKAAANVSIQPYSLRNKITFFHRIELLISYYDKKK